MICLFSAWSFLHNSSNFLSDFVHNSFIFTSFVHMNPSHPGWLPQSPEEPWSQVKYTFGIFLFSCCKDHHCLQIWSWCVVFFWSTSPSPANLQRVMDDWCFIEAVCEFGSDLVLSPSDISHPSACLSVRWTNSEHTALLTNSLFLSLPACRTAIN